MREMGEKGGRAFWWKKHYYVSFREITGNIKYSSLASGYPVWRQLEQTELGRWVGANLGELWKSRKEVGGPRVEG